jgi:hypothetical protein
VLLDEGDLVIDQEVDLRDFRLGTLGVATQLTLCGSIV